MFYFMGHEFIGFTKYINLKSYLHSAIENKISEEKLPCFTKNGFFKVSQAEKMSEWVWLLLFKFFADTLTNEN